MRASGGLGAGEDFSAVGGADESLAGVTFGDTREGVVEI